MIDYQSLPSTFPGQVSEITAAYLSRQAVTLEALPGVITAIALAVQGLYVPPAPVVEPQPEPAVPIKRSVTADAIICLDCGTKHTSIRRHLRTAHDLSPDAYRERWGLPPDYPMVTAAYSQRRSDLAKQHGLGRNH